MDKPSRLLSRSPVFRRAYYQRMAEMADRLTPEAANQLLKNIEADAGAHGFLGKVNEFLGGDQATKQIVDAAGKANGTLGRSKTSTCTPRATPSTTPRTCSTTPPASATSKTPADRRPVRPGVQGDPHLVGPAPGPQPRRDLPPC
jgi:hypothetical protein